MRRLAAGLLSALVGLGGVLVLPAAAAGAAEADGSDVSVERYGGVDRYVTSLQVAEAVAADAGGSLSSVVLVSGRRWTDAVVAAPLAGALGAPVLMTPPDELRADALEFLQRVGVSSAVVVGPDASGGGHGPGRGVGAGVLEALEAAGITADRVAGDDRFGTGVAAARRVTPGVMGELGATAVIASGEVFADALVAGPIAARGVHPVLLSSPGELHAGVAGYLGEAGISHVVLMGGTAALSAAVEQSIKDLGIEVSRVAGSTRYDTAVKAAELAEGRYSDAAGKPCFGTAVIGVARARVPFDSFSAAPLLGRLCAPLVLADPKQVPADTAAFLDTARDAHDALGLQVFGGDAAVSRAAIDAYLTGEEPDTGEDDEEPSTAPGVLPAGTCGGSASDPVRRLSDDPKSQDPAWSPDCTQLAYSERGSLWTVNNDGTDARKLVDHSGAFLDEPAWSPDGTRVAFIRGDHNTAGHWERHIWVVDADGSGAVQLTTGDIDDQHPSWSPDGTQIAFSRLVGSGRDGNGDRLDADRYIAVVNADGTSLVSLTEGGPWDHSPAWSPDGAQIAYVAGRAVRLVDPGGGPERAVAGGAWWDGGLSWSPDGTAVAFGRPNADGGTDIVRVNLDGIGERQLTDLQGWATGPSWSPDGQLISFTHYDQTGDERDRNSTRYASVMGARSGTPLEHAARCRPIGRTNDTTAGFPLPDWAPSARGTVRVAVLFVDFDDAQAAHTTEEEAALGLPWAEEYLEKNSYRKLDVQYVPHHTWLRAPGSYRDYLEESATGSMRVQADSLYADAVALIDDEFDFTGFHSLAVVLPSTHFDAGVAGGSIEADGTSMRRHINNNAPRDEPVKLTEVDDWGSTAAHELVHNLGLLDMYPYDKSLHERPEPPDGQEWIPIDFGLMHLDAYFLAHENDDRLQRRGRWPDGGTWTDFSTSERDSQEMLAWSRWQLGWLHERQAACITDDTAVVMLAPVARTGGAVAMAALPIDSHRVMVIESRRRIGYDRDASYTWPDGGSARWRALVEEGVLVYTVDTLIDSGRLPVKIAGDPGNGQVDDFPVLQIGESVSVLGWTITVSADDGKAHTVSITRSG